MFITAQYRLLPRKSQHRALERILESQRELYNAALEERIAAYRKAGVTITYFDQTRELTEWRRDDPDARRIPVSLQRATLKRMHDAYQAFFRRAKQGEKAGFPRFRGKGRFNSFEFRALDGIKLERGALHFRGVPGRLRVHWHRELPHGGLIKACVFKREQNGWKVSFQVSIEPCPPRSERRAVGIDLGISTFATFSDGGFIPSLNAARKAEHRMRMAQRALSRKKRGSGTHRKARAQLARCHAATFRKRKEHLHQASARLLRDYDVIAVEKLNVKALAAGILAKDVRDAAWSKFISLLRYKAEWAGARLIEVDPHNTSQECSRCGITIYKALAQRRHQCWHCGLSLDRDLNAARNILNRVGVDPSLRNVVGCDMRAGGNLDWAERSKHDP